MLGTWSLNMTLKKRSDITHEVKKIEAEGLDANQRAIDLALLAEKTKQTFENLSSGITTEVKQEINQSSLDTQHSIDLKHQSEIKKVEDTSIQLDEYQNKLEVAISADINDINQIDKLKNQASLAGTDSSALQEAKITKQQEIEFLSQIDRTIDKTQEQLRQHLAENKQKRKKSRKEYNNKDLSPVLEQPSKFENSDGDKDSTEHQDSDLSEFDFLPTGVHFVEDLQKFWTELSPLISSFINKTIASATIPLSMLVPLISSPPFIQMTRTGINILKKIVQIYPDAIDLSNRTIGSEFSHLPNDSLFKSIAELSEKNDRIIFGEFGELAGYTENKKEEDEINNAAGQRVFNDTSSAGGSPPKPPKEPSIFAKSLSYGHLYGKNQPISFEKTDNGGTLQALLPDGRNSECYINYSIDDSGRIKIGDIQVPPSLQRQGIATLLFKDLEERVPVGTTFFFEINDRPQFWKSVGFEFNDQTKEYYKVKID
jgi:hypothetical protein